MGINRRSSQIENIGPGPYLAKIVNHLDPTYMGSLEVAVMRAIPGQPATQSSNVIVKYCTPFYNVTSAAFEGNDSASFNDVQKSSGFWMVPPDIGTTVLVIFIEGDINQGYWFGCVPDQFQNHMVPGIAASKYTAIGPGDEDRYGTTNLPVAEFHKASRNMDVPNPDSFTKPVHPFADRLLQQGLLIDNIRGITSSSARREVPSQVFGISTPGPVDTRVNAPRKQIGFQDSSAVSIPVSRLGGTTFVMDDGDKDGQNELVRIRTRTGHQILLHNSSDLIYIGNSKGSAWIELTSNGKMDVYCEDSISMHTKGDFNLRADRDFNIEAGRNFNVATRVDMNLNIDQNFNTICDQMLTQVTGDSDLTISGHFNSSIKGDHNIGVGGSAFYGIAGNHNLGVAGESRYTVSGNIGISSAGIIAISGATQVGITSNDIRLTAGKIDLNGENAAGPAIAAAVKAAVVPDPLNLYALPQRDTGSGWSNGNWYKTTDLTSIMQRVPTHEPWEQHENINPAQFTLDKTSSSIAATTKAANGAIIEADPSANIPYPAKNGPATDKGTFKTQPFSWSTDQPFLTKVKDVATSLAFDPYDLLAIMNLESARTFDPYIRNNLGFTGLIQFGTPAASGLGTTTDALRAMSRVQQMDYVYAYFHKLWGWPNAKCPNPTLVNLYLTVLLPAFRFAGPDEKIADASNPKSAGWYNANKGFDPSRLGYFTPSMVEKTVLLHKREITQVLAKANVGSDFIVPTA